MSSAVFAPVEPPANFKRWDIPVKWGIIIGIVSILWTTINGMFILPRNYMAYLVLTFAVFAVMIVLYGVAGAKQRKAMGGYISFKDAFAAIFIAILISSAISSIWGFVYAKWIDPHMVEKIKDGTLSFMERMKVPQDKIDEQAANFDKQVTDSQRPAQLLFSYAKGLIFLSIFGMICAAIVKRAPKETMA